MIPREVVAQVVEVAPEKGRGEDAVREAMHVGERLRDVFQGFGIL